MLDKDLNRLYVLILFLLPLSSLAQKIETRTNEEQVAKEGMFIEAKKLKVLGDLTNSAKRFEVLLEKHRDHDVAAYELAEIHLINGDLDEARRWVDRAVSHSPDNVWYHLLRAEIEISEENYTGVAEVYDQLLTLEPNNLEYLRSKGLYLSEANQYDKAIEVFDEIEDRVGVTERTSLLKFQFQKNLGKDKKAISELERLIETFPENVNYRHHLANYYRELGKKSLMEGVFRDILEIDAEDARASVALASSFRKQGDHQNYLMSIRSILQNPEADIDLKIAELMPFVRSIQEDPQAESLDAVLESLRLLEQAHPSDPKAYALHGDVLSLTGQDRSAVEKYRKTIELNPSNYLVWEQYLSILAELKEFAILADDSEEAMDYFPNQVRIYFLHGLAQTSLGEYAAAKNALTQAVLMSGNDDQSKTSIFALLGKVTAELGEDDKATDYYREALLLKNDVRLKNDFARHLARSGGDLVEAMALNAEALKSDGKDPRFHATKGLIEYKSGKLKGALTSYDKAIDLGGDRYSYILEEFGDVHFSSGDSDEAVRWWEAARVAGADSEELNRKIETRKLSDAQ